MQNGCWSILKDDRIQCLVPAEHKACNAQYDRIEAKYNIEGVHIAFLWKINGYKVRSTWCCTTIKAEANGNAVYHSSEDAYEKHVLGDYVVWDKVGEKAVEQYHHAGKSRELFADKSETDIHGDYVQSYVYDAERKHYACKLFHCTLYEYGHSCHSAWVKTACVYKGLCV